MQVGAWGCFDEFNRLEERMLSAVSQQVQTIQEALKDKAGSSSSKSAAQGNFCVGLFGIVFSDKRGAFTKILLPSVSISIYSMKPHEACQIYICEWS